MTKHAVILLTQQGQTFFLQPQRITILTGGVNVVTNLSF